ncbi:MAG TPA: aldolase/citrate lyase family protein [Tepidanaerobacteraceae bacterium]|nr:aldolase/citrate lyase family protein [Tepidanaerobacteraceae bacterium]
MYKNTLKEKLQTGENVVGCIIQGAIPPLVEICGLVGFDFVFLDAEHGPLSVRECEELIRAAEARNIIPLVRVRKNDPELILRYLDVGAMGIIIPGVRNKEEAEQAVQAVKYYPRGNRGLSATRSSDYGLGMAMKDYVEYANQQTMVLAVIENVDAVNNIEEILGVDGMDGAIIGTSDLAQSLGYPGQGKHPAVQEAFKKALEGGIRVGKPIGGVVRAGETAKTYFEQGCKMAVKSAYGIFAGAAKEFVRSAKS